MYNYHRQRDKVESEHKLDEVYFPVELCDATYTISRSIDLFGQEVETTEHRIDNLRIVVDVERRHIFAQVSDKYVLVTNKEAYEWSKDILPLVFPESKFEDFRCYNVRMKASRAACWIDLIRSSVVDGKGQTAFGPHNEWTAFLRICNSYDTTMSLHYEIGFCRWICKNGVVFSNLSDMISLKHIEGVVSHDKLLDALKDDARKNRGLIRGIEQDFRRKLFTLCDVSMPENMMLPMLCQIFGIRLEENDLKSMSPERIMSARSFAISIGASIRAYVADMGQTGGCDFISLRKSVIFVPCTLCSAFLTTHSGVWR